MLTGTGKPLELDYPWEQKNKDGSITNAAYPFGFSPTFHRYRLDEPQSWKKPRNIFVCSMAGPVPITIDDYARISNYLQGNSYAREVVRRKHEPLQRVFLDDAQRKCAIYSVRPMVCRLFGVAKGMTCSHGNSAEIDSAGLIDFSQTFCGCQNDMDWNVSERPK